MKIKRFCVGLNTKQLIDGSSETEGLEVSSDNFVGQYRDGILVVHVGRKALQNFKIVPLVSNRRGA